MSLRVEKINEFVANSGKLTCNFAGLQTSDLTERRGRVVNTPVSYSEGPGFKSRPGTAYPVRFSVVFHISSRHAGIIP
jgi:hypothetical protein